MLLVLVLTLVTRCHRFRLQVALTTVNLLLFSLFKVQVQLLDALPYILTVVILAGFVGKAIPPRAGGEPYVKER